MLKVPVKQEVLDELHEMYKDKTNAEIIRTCKPVSEELLVPFREYGK